MTENMFRVYRRSIRPVPKSPTIISSATLWRIQQRQRLSISHQVDGRGKQYHRSGNLQHLPTVSGGPVDKASNSKLPTAQDQSSGEFYKRLPNIELLFLRLVLMKDLNKA